MGALHSGNLKEMCSTATYHGTAIAKGLHFYFGQKDSFFLQDTSFDGREILKKQQE